MQPTLISGAVAIFATALLPAMSLRANRRFNMEPRLPMQWGLDGSVNWTAQRRTALAFTPILAGICLTGIVALTAFLKPRAGQEDFVAPVNFFVAMVFVGAHALHLWLIRRTVQRQG